MATITYKFNANTTGFNKGIQSIKNSTSSAGRAVNKTQSGYASWFRTNKKLGSSFVNLNKDINRSNKSMLAFGKALSLTAGIAAARMLAQGLQTVVQASMDAIETQNLFNVALGETAEQAEGVVQNLNKVYGLDPTNLRSAMGTFALLGKSMGFSAEQANTLSTQTTQMALDLASLTNVDIKQVMGDLKSGLVGQSETVYKYGIDVTEAALKQEALAQGISKSVRNMSQGEKMALRYAVMARTLTRDLGNGLTISGDFARTLEQPANQARILAEKVVTLSRSIGNIFIPILTRVLPYLIAFVDIMIYAADAIAAFVGFEMPQTVDLGAGLGTIEEGADDADDAIGGVTKAIKEMQKTMLGIDELNVMAKPTTTAGSGSGGGDTGSILPEFEMPSIYDKLAELPSRAKEIFLEMKKAIEDSGALDIIDNIVEIFQNLYDLYVTLSDYIKDNNLEFVLAPLDFGTQLQQLIDLIDGITEALAGLTAGDPAKTFEGLNDALGATDVGETLQTLFDPSRTMGEKFIAAFKPGDVGKLGLMPVISQLWALSVVIDLVTTGIDKLTEWLWNDDNKIGFEVDFSSIDVDLLKKKVEEWFGTNVKTPIEEKVIEIKKKIKYLLTFGENFIADLKLKIGTWFNDNIRTPVNDKVVEIKKKIKYLMWFGDNLITDLKLKISTWFTDNIATPANNKVIEIKNKIKYLLSFGDNVITDLRTRISNWFRDNVKTPVSEKVEEIKQKIGFNFTVDVGDMKTNLQEFRDNFETVFKTVVNKLISGINESISTPFIKLNGLLNSIRNFTIFGKTPFKTFISYNAIDIPSIPKLANGGIVEHSTVAEIGEAGAEAVMPLDPSKLKKYFEPVLGNIKDDRDPQLEYRAVYNAVKDAMKESPDGEYTINLYLDGVYDQTVTQMKRKNTRAGRVIIPVGG